VNHGLRPYRLTSVTLSAALAVISTLQMFGGEKATISVPTKPSSTPNLTAPPPPTTSFQPLNRDSSVGGVVDPAAAPGPVAPSIPDARTQKELFERLDRKKNWLLDDGSGPTKSPGEALLMDSGAELDYSTNPRRPQTALERRLKSGARTATTEAAERDAWQRASQTDQDNSSVLESGLDGFGRGTLSSGLSPLWSETAPRGRGLQAAPTVDLAPSQNFRSSVSASHSRAAGLDSMTQERMERYQRTFGMEETAERTSSLGASIDSSRARELRSDVMGQLIRAGSDPRTAATAGLARDDAIGASTVTRSPLADPGLALGVVANPYLGPPTPPPAYVSPAAKMIRAQPTEIPRFRP
jgi:hypothetical protein